MNLGIGDATDHAARLTGGKRDGYETARHPDGAHVVKLSERGLRMVQSASPVGAVRSLRP